MKKSLFSMLVLLFVGLQSLFAQTKEISGVVTSADDGLTLPGVSVIIKGTTIGTTTDFDGQYILKVPTGSNTLVFSFVGMTSKEVAIKKSTVNVVMSADAISVDEVIVVAYGTSKKSSFTGSASNISSEAIVKSSSSSFESALQGQSAGVQVVSTSGQPGSASAIRIRGIGSISGVSTPLYVIDGVAVNSENYSRISSESGNGTSTSPLASLNPADIANITVLKDASAAALYGSRAANGVILITTKQGAKGKTKINFSAKHGISDLAVKQHDVLNASQYYKLYFDAAMATNGGDAAKANETVIDQLSVKGNTINPYNVDNPLDKNGKLVDGAKLLYDTDWRDAIFRLAKTDEYNLSASGGNDKTKFYMSAGYLDQEGIVLGSNYSRMSTKMNVSNKVTDFLTVGMNNSLSLSTQDTPPGSGGGASPINFSNSVSNVYPIYTWDKGARTNDYNYVNSVSLDFNPIALQALDTYESESIRILSSAYVDLAITDDIKFRSQVSFDRSNMRENQFSNSEHGNGSSVGGRGNRYNITEVTKSITNTLNWSKEFGGKHNIGVLLGQEATHSRYDLASYEAVGFVFPGTQELIATSKPTTVSTYYREKALSSYFSRVNYDYAGRYYFSTSFRRDGSSIFGSENRWGNFWSVAGSWRVSQESFMQDITFLDNLKLRASYGINGSDAVRVYERYVSRDLFRFGMNYGGKAGISDYQAGNKDLSWEKLKAWDVALEFRVFNKLSGTLGYYSKVSDGLLYDRNLSSTVGVTSVKSNIAEISNSGFEVELSSDNYRSDNFSWTTDFNLAANTNEITSLPEDKVIDGSKRWEVGKDRYQFFIEKFAGVDAEDGRSMWYRTEADGSVITTKNYSQATKFNAGSALPDFTAGLTNNLTYKNFDLSFMFYFSVGGKILDYTKSNIMHMGSSIGKQLSTDVLNAWKQKGDKTDVAVFEPKNSHKFASRSTRYLYDNSFIRLRNVTLGYNFSRNLLSKYKLSSLRLYVQADNAWTYQQHEGLDPEQSISGITNNNMPNVKTFSVGVKLGL